MEAWQERVVQERNELEEKLGKLNIFLADQTKTDALRIPDVVLLKRQRAAMAEYSNVLNLRIMHFDPSKLVDTKDS